jgi:hypothetical protein
MHVDVPLFVHHFKRRIAATVGIDEASVAFLED